MPKDTPLRVTPAREGMKRSVDGVSWVITIGSTKRDISGHSTKQSAIDVATLKAEESRRPGVVIENRFGKYQRFEPNDRYWSKELW